MSRTLMLTAMAVATAFIPFSEAHGAERIGGIPLDLAQMENGVDWQAHWIQDPLFKDLPLHNLLRKEKSEERSERPDSDPQNVHSLFRKVFEIPNRKIRTARLFITADDVYKLYLNGKFIGLGPAPSYAFAYNFNGWDVTSNLKQGSKNCIGAHVYYQGLVNRVWESGDNRQGLAAQLEIKFTDGTRQTVLSDETWRMHRSEAYPGRRTTGYKTQFLEDIELDKIQHGWSKSGFNASDWIAPYAQDEFPPLDYTLVPQITPPLYTETVHPQRVVRTGEGRYFIDFGRELTGSTVFRVSGPAGHIVEIRHGEELSGPNQVRYEMRASSTYQELVTLAGRKDDRIEFFDYKGFRYAEVLFWPEELRKEDVWVINRHYPFPENYSFHSSNELLNRIWDLCIAGARQGTQDGYLDCPTREKGAYLGDAYVTAKTHLYATGDTRIPKKALQDFANTARICPGLMAVAPGHFMQEIADYSLLWPVILEWYYRWSGDLDFVREMQPVLDGLLDYFAAYENEAGLLENVDEKWNLVDWPKNLRDDYDYDRAIAGVNTVLNEFYFGCLRSASNLAVYTGQDERAARLSDRMSNLGGAIKQNLADPQSGLFVDALGSGHSALHANALPLMFGIRAPLGNAPLVDLLRGKRISCGVYFSSFLLEGLYNAGEPDLAYDLMTSHDERSWYNMLESGATTCMEAWGPDQKWNTSWCHPWSSAPVFITAENMMGLRPASPGWETIDFFPQPPRDLAYASLSIPSPKGTIYTSFRNETEESGTRNVIYLLTVPEGCFAAPRFSGVSPLVIVNGIEHKCIEEGGQVRLPVLLSPGDHEIQTVRE